MLSPQRSIWSLDEELPILHGQSFSLSIRNSIINIEPTVNDWSNDTPEDREGDLQKTGTSMWWTCIQGCIIGSLLLGIVLAIILTLWLRQPSQKTTITTFKALLTTSVSSTSTTLTTTTATSSTTRTTATTTTTTTTVTTITTTTMTTTSTSTTITTDTTTTTTPTPPCIPMSVNSNSTLYTTTSGSATTYTCYAYAWTSSTTGTVSLAFQFRHDPDYWFLDDVSIYYGSSQMLSNGGFETGSLSPWVKTYPYGTCSGFPGQVYSGSSSYNGNYYFRDGCNGKVDQISQQFTAIAGDVYIVSFWLKSGGTGSGILAQVTLS